MKNIMTQQLTKRIVQWLLLAMILAYLITGFGITEYRIVESLTFGLLTKLLAFKIHDNLWIPFIVLLALHIYQRVRKPA
jgi:dolichol kinase